MPSHQRIGAGTSASEALVTRLQQNKQKMLPTANYSSLTERLGHAKISSGMSQTKVAKLQKDRKRENRDKIMGLHKKVWTRECHRLEEQRLLLEHSIERILYHFREDHVHMADAIGDAHAGIVARFFDAEVLVQHKVDTMRLALHAYVPPASSHQQTILTIGSGENSNPGPALETDTAHPADIRAKVRELQELLAGAVAAYSNPAIRLWAEIQSVASRYIHKSHSISTAHGIRTAGSDAECAWGPHLATVLPEGATEIPDLFPLLSMCDDEEIQLYVATEFNNFVAEVNDRNTVLDESFRQITTLGESCGWSNDDHEWYLKLECEYVQHGRQTDAQGLGTTPVGVDVATECKAVGTSVRQLMIGRMLLERPAFQRKDIVEHEQTLSSWRFYVSQKALLATTLREDFATLQDTVHHHLQEVLTLQRTKAVEAEARAAFDAVRLRLKEKVLTWHHARLDAARQRESLDALRERDRTALQAREREREAAHREHLKRCIKAFQQEKALTARLAHEAELKRLALEEAEAKEAAARNAERVDFRRTAERQRQQALEAQQAAEAVVLQEREARLQALRDLVAVTAVRDSARARQHTKASKAAADAPVDVSTWTGKNPATGRAFDPQGYTVDAIAKDKRLRVEAALRSQGLHDTPYAREVMRSVPAPTRPRPGLTSTIFEQSPAP
eukprot:m.1384972 g.1384972  ORF g.1384972 m.1384972 type:complete len:677 (+) comp24975_c1_seq29:282-2312(+)